MAFGEGGLGRQSATDCWGLPARDRDARTGLYFHRFIRDSAKRASFVDETVRNAAPFCRRSDRTDDPDRSLMSYCVSENTPDMCTQDNVQNVSDYLMSETYSTCLITRPKREGRAVDRIVLLCEVVHYETTKRSLLMSSAARTPAPQR